MSGFLVLKKIGIYFQRNFERLRTEKQGRSVGVPRPDHQGGTDGTKRAHIGIATEENIEEI